MNNGKQSRNAPREEPAHRSGGVTTVRSTFEARFPIAEPAGPSPLPQLGENAMLNAESKPEAVETSARPRHPACSSALRRWAPGLLALGVAGGLGSLASTAQAQGAKEYGKGVRLDLNPDQGQYFRFITWMQLWSRYIENNPGTLVDGEEQDSTWDVGLRRVRFLGYGKLSPKLTVLLHMGINNQTYNGTRKPQLFVHGAWTQYDVVDKALTLGVGLHYWHGISRMTNASTLNFLAADAPITNWPTIERSDQFARDLGIFAKGKLGPVDYRLALNKPFSFEGSPGPDRADYILNNDSVAVAGYASWEFLDSESNLLPYTVGSYLGSKRVFNLGAGFRHQTDATATEAADGTRTLHNINLFGLDAFADLPLGDGSALTAYGVLYLYDFGPNHIRNIGIMNMGTGGTSFNGAGNAYPSIGTGEHVYAQVGYLLPGRYSGTQLQPYVTAQLSNLEALDDPATVFEVGLNWLVVGHHAKITTNYRSRPIFAVQEAGPPTSDGRASEVLVQSMMYF